MKQMMSAGQNVVRMHYVVRATMTNELVLPQGLTILINLSRRYHCHLQKIPTSVLAAATQTRPHLGSGCGVSPHAVRPADLGCFCCGAESLRPADIWANFCSFYLGSFDSFKPQKNKNCMIFADNT